ncbi:MAG: hypothetical protein ACREL9_10485, partial [Gemmatimonadales bacterium]
MTDGAATYRLHGLRVRSEIPLPTPAAGPAGAPPPDLDVGWGDGPMRPAPPAGDVLARFAPRDGCGYTHVATESGYTLHYAGTCEFRLDPARRVARAHLAPGVAPELASILLTGNVLAVVLALEGACVLHASAVAVNGGALALVGGVGMGKSTLAALLCAAGATLVTDDLLRVALDRVRAFPGPPELRLRPGAG